MAASHNRTCPSTRVHHPNPNARLSEKSHSQRKSQIVLCSHTHYCTHAYKTHMHTCRWAHTHVHTHIPLCTHVQEQAGSGHAYVLANTHVFPEWGSHTCRQELLGKGGDTWGISCLSPLPGQALKPPGNANSPCTAHLAAICPWHREAPSPPHPTQQTLEAAQHPHQDGHTGGNATEHSLSTVFPTLNTTVGSGDLRPAPASGYLS